MKLEVVNGVVVNSQPVYEEIKDEAPPKSAAQTLKEKIKADYNKKAYTK